MEDKWIFVDREADDGISFIFDTEEEAINFAKEYHWACLNNYGEGLHKEKWRIEKAPFNPDFKTWWDNKNW